MNDPHDLGGQMGFGPVRPDPGAAPFHAAWEGRALGLTLCAGALGRWTLDESRHARESLPPPVYYSASYFEIWTRALESLLLRHGLISETDLDAPDAVAEAGTHPRRLSPDRVPATLARGGPTDRAIAAPARFAPGDRVRARNIHPRGHTRLPRYVRGHIGIIEADHGGHVFPDTNAHGQGEAPQRLYTVVFDGPEIWGPDAEPGLRISVDAWESYLEPV